MVKSETGVNRGAARLRAMGGLTTPGETRGAEAGTTDRSAR
jgi:hypothetical protein